MRVSVITSLDTGKVVPENAGYISYIAHTKGINTLPEITSHFGCNFKLEEKILYNSCEPNTDKAHMSKCNVR